MQYFILNLSQAGLLASLVVFQLFSGIYWPAMATVKGSVVEEGIRATVYSLYRVPLNFLTFGVMLVSVSWRFPCVGGPGVGRTRRCMQVGSELDHGAARDPLRATVKQRLETEVKDTSGRSLISL